AFADFINAGGAEIAQLYRERCAGEPHVAVAAWIICADTDEEAQRLASSSRMTLRLLRQGKLIPVPPPDKALAYLAEQGAGASTPGRRGIIGSPETVRAGVEQLAADYGADEVIAVTITYDHEARKRSYELLADAFALRRSPPRPRAAAPAPRSPTRAA